MFFIPFHTHLLIVGQGSIKLDKRLCFSTGSHKQVPEVFVINENTPCPACPLKFGSASAQLCHPSGCSELLPSAASSRQVWPTKDSIRLRRWVVFWGQVNLGPPVQYVSVSPLQRAHAFPWTHVNKPLFSKKDPVKLHVGKQKHAHLDFSTDRHAGVLQGFRSFHEFSVIAAWPTSTSDCHLHATLHTITHYVPNFDVVLMIYLLS